MKSKKIAMIIASSTIAITVLASSPAISAFADTTSPASATEHSKTVETPTSSKPVNKSTEILNEHKNPDMTKNLATKSNSTSNKKESTKDSHVATKSAKGGTKEEATNGNVPMSFAADFATHGKVQLQKVNLFTGKVIKTTNKEKEKAQEKAQSFAITFHGPSNITYYNGKNLHPDMTPTEFHSATQEKLYDYLLDPAHRWNAENEAIGLHNGTLANNCVFFASSALRAIGVPIPDNIGYTTNLMAELQSLGWEKETDLSTLEPGDICFASVYHTFVFMGWANKSEGIAWVADNQISWFGTNFHPRDTHSVPDEDVSPTTCYYRLPGPVVKTGGNPNVPKMPKNYSYGVGTSTTDGLHVRSNPSLNASIIGVLNAGQRVQILANDGNWDKVMYNGQVAYIWASYLTGSAPVSEKPYTITNDYKAIAKGFIEFEGGPGYTDLTFGPSWSQAGAGSLNNGTEVTITGEQDGWYRLSLNGNVVWVMKNRVVVPANSLNPTTIKTGIIENPTDTFTDVTNGPNWNTNICGSINNGTKIDITGEYGDWYRVAQNGGQVWVPKSMVTTLAEMPSIGTGTISFSQNPFTSVTNGPSWSTGIVANINNGTKVTIYGEKDGWYKIGYNGGLVWVLSDRIDTSLNKNEPVISNEFVNTNGASNVSVYAGNNTNADSIGTLTNGTPVQVVSHANNGWTEINFQNRTAWIQNSNLSKVKPEKVIGTGIINFNGEPYTCVTNSNGWSSGIVGSINNGTKVNIYGEKDGWYKVSYNGSYAWVLNNRIETSLNTNKPVISTGYIENGAIGYTSLSSGPNWNDDFMGTLNNGTLVQIVGHAGDWSEINLGSSTAWVLTARISDTNPSKVIGSGTVNFNGGPFTDITQSNGWESGVVGSLNNGTKVSIYAKRDGWYKINYNGGFAWILNNRIETSLNKNQPTKSTAYINNGSVGYTVVVSGPNWNDDFIGNLNNGTKVDVVGSYNGWTEINFKNSTAWIPSTRLSETKPASVIGSGTINYTGGSYTCVTSSNGWESGIVGNINNGTTVPIYAEKDGWYKIGFNGGYAWVLNDRISTSLNKNQPVLSTGYINNGSLGYTSLSSGPNWNDDFMGTLNNGTSVQVVGHANGWSEINYGTSTAWVLSSRISEKKVPVVLSIGTINFNGDPYTCVTSGPSWTSGIVGQINNNTQVPIYGEQHGWYKIGYNGGYAWVLNNRINTLLNTNEPAISTGYITNGEVGYTSLSSGPSWNDDYMGTLNNGTKVQVVSTFNGWSQINYGTSTVWVPSNRIVKNLKIYNKVQYDYTMSQYVARELQEYNATYNNTLTKAQLEQATNELSQAINPAYAKTDLQFLRVDTYRNVNEQALANLLNGKGVFSGQAQGFIDAAKEYNLDPVYLVAQSALETGWGSSNFAEGITITQIANTNAPIKNANGEVTGYQMINLPNPVTVYNLFGIGAYDATSAFPNRPTILGTTYAYNHGWTNVPAAIAGAAKFLSNDYVHNPNIAQNTPYELRYINAPSQDIWHQYSSNIQYAQLIAKIMYENRNIYSQGDTFTFNIPTFNS